MNRTEFEQRLQRFPALRVARRESFELLRRIESCVETLQDEPRLVCLAVAGSLGRLERTRRSDLDLIVVAADDLQRDQHSRDELQNDVWRRLQPLDLPRGQPDGIFARPVTSAKLCSPETLGVIDEDVTIYGTRMQLLLEGRPVLGESRYRKLLWSILRRFIDATAADRTGDVWRPLIDDLLRYHRSLCVRYRHARRREPGRWRELQLKAGYSRLVNVAGLLLLFAESLRSGEDPVPWVLDRLKWTPLQRIAAAIPPNSDAQLEEVLSVYDRFLAAMNDEPFRREILFETDPVSEVTCQKLKTLHENASRLKRELTGLLLDRSHAGEQSRRFLEDLIL